jgi:hypothetical protein
LVLKIACLADRQVNGTKIRLFYGKIGYTEVSQAYRRMEEKRGENRAMEKLIATLDNKIDKRER